MRRPITCGDEIIVRRGFGVVRVMVPPGSRVEMCFGSKRSEVIGDPPDGGPVVRLKSWALFGDVRVA